MKVIQLKTSEIDRVLNLEFPFLFTRNSIVHSLHEQLIKSNTIDQPITSQMTIYQQHDYLKSLSQIICQSKYNKQFEKTSNIPDPLANPNSPSNAYDEMRNKLPIIPVIRESVPERELTAICMYYNPDQC
eukprot:NODE_272_length_11042_cov_1.328338.p3 type:complete len:130 gc:universal NODE_272_length_11042_cov_1.328338:2659-3048(+)